MFKLLSKREAGELFGVSYYTVGRLIADSELEAIRIGRQVRIHPDALQNYFNRHAINLTGKESENESATA